MKSKSLKFHASLTLIANASMAVGNWALLIILAKNFSVQLLGEFVLALSICSPVFLFAGLRFRTLLVVDRSWEYTLEQYFAARWWATLIASIGILISSIWVSSAISLYILLAVIGYRLLDSYSELSNSYFRRIEQFSLSSLLISLRAISNIACLIATAWLRLDFHLVLLIWLLCNLLYVGIEICLVKLLAKAQDSIELSWWRIISKRSYLRTAVGIFRKYATLGIAVIISSLFVYIPNYILASFSSVEDAGRFATLTYFLVAGGIVINSVSQACSPRLVRYLGAGQATQFNRLVGYMCWFGGLLGLAATSVAFFLGEFFLKVFYNAEISQYYQELTVIMVAAAIRYSYIFIGTGLSAVKSFAIQTRIYGCGLLVLLTTCLALIPYWGLMGAAVALVVATLCELLLFALLSRRTIQAQFLKLEAQAHE